MEQHSGHLNTIKHDDGIASLSHTPANEVPSWKNRKARAAKWMSTGAHNDRKTSVLVAALVSLFLSAITFTAFAVTSPRTSSPIVTLDEHPPIPEEFITEVLDYVFHRKDPSSFASSSSSNSTHDLEKRKIPLKLNKLCGQNDEWVRRDCESERSQSAWVDVCSKRDALGRGVIYLVRSTCPPSHNCVEHLEKNGKSFILCVPREPTKKDVVTTDTDQRTSGQYGFRSVQEVWDLSQVEQMRTITVKADMGGGTAGGFLSDGTSSYIIAPNRALVGHVRGGEEALCQSGSNTRASRECTPLARHDFKIDDKMDFTFGVSFGQKVVLFYSLWGSHG